MSKVTTTFAAEDQGMTATIRKINGDMDTMKGTASGATGKVSSGFSTMALGAAAAGAAFAAFNIVANAMGDALRGSFNYVKDATKNASDLGETVSKVGEIFGAESNQITEWAKGAAQSLGQSKTVAMDAAAQFAIFGKAAGLGGTELVGFSTELTALATDLASFNNTTPEEAILAVGSALRGEAEPMRRFGVLLDDASLRNEALKMGLIATTKDALTPQQKVLAAHALIMAQTTVAQGDFARTSGGLANQQKILSANMANLSAEVGKVFLPIVTELTAAFNNYAIPALQKFSEKFSGVDTAGWGKRMVQNVIAMGDVLIGAFLSPRKAVDALFHAMLLGAKNNSNALLNGFITAGQFLTNYFTSEIPSLLVGNMGSALIVAFTTGLAFLSSKLSQLIGALPELVGGAVRSVVLFLNDSFQKVVKFFAEDFSNALRHPIDFISGKLESQLNKAGASGAYEFKQAYDEQSGSVLDKFSSGMTGVADLYAERITENNKKIGEELKGITEGIGSDIDFFGSEETRKKLKDDLKSMKAAGEEWRGKAKEAGDELSAGEASAAAIKSSFDGAAAATTKIAADLRLSTKLAKEFQENKDKAAVDRGGKLEQRAKDFESRGRDKAAARTIERIKTAESEAAIREGGETRDRRSLSDIAKAEGIDTFRKTKDQLRDEILKKRAAEKDAKGGKKDDPGKGGKQDVPPAKQDPQITLLTVCQAMQKLLEKIEPKLPTAALGL